MDFFREAGLRGVAATTTFVLDGLGKLDLGPPNPVGTQDSDVSDDSWDAVIGFRGEYSLSYKWYINYQFKEGFNHEAWI